MALQTPKTRFEHAQPILRVSDMKASLHYYVDVLGFRNAEWGSEDFTFVTLDGAGIYLCRGERGCAGTWAWIGVGDTQQGTHMPRRRVRRTKSGRPREQQIRLRVVCRSPLPGA